VRELTGLLRTLPARAYSIASSPLAHPDEAHLLVGLVGYETHGRARQGVTSGHVAHRLAKGAQVGVYARPNRHFRLPEPDVPIIMVGPGTGVAPFRAFVEHRREQGAKGKSWLFFGERRFTHDFLYQLEWQEAVAEGSLTRMDVAFSRDTPRRSTSSTGCGPSARTCGRGSRTAPCSTCAATRRAWRRTWSRPCAGSRRTRAA
jgi:sulfite reductase (NADPH) flavoprotein alpha-component